MKVSLSAVQPDAQNDAGDYVLEDQIGFLLRVAMQRHTAIFLSKMVDGLTQAQFATLAKLYRGGCSQNELGRLISLDAATINGIIGRMKTRGMVAVKRDSADKRLRLLSLTEKGRDVVERGISASLAATVETLAPLSRAEAVQVVKLLKKLA